MCSFFVNRRTICERAQAACSYFLPAGALLSSRRQDLRGGCRCVRDLLVCCAGEHVWLAWLVPQHCGDTLDTSVACLWLALGRCRARCADTSRQPHTHQPCRTVGCFPVLSGDHRAPGGSVAAVSVAHTHLVADWVPCSGEVRRVEPPLHHADPWGARRRPRWPVSPKSTVSRRMTSGRPCSHPGWRR